MKFDPTDNKQRRRAITGLIQQMIRNGEPCWKQYIEGVFRDNKNDRLIFAEHQGIMFEFIHRKLNIENYDRVTIEAPWGHTKTQSIALFYPTFAIGINPRIRIKIISSKDTVATPRVGANRLTIEENSDYQAIFPHIKQGDKWGEQLFRVKGSATSATDYTMEGYGVGSGRMGGRGDLIIFDDICDFDNSMTEDQRNKIRDKIDLQWLSRLAPGGKVINVDTPWNREDGIQQVTRNWQRLQIKVSEDIDCLEIWENGALVKQIQLWDQWPAEKLEEIRKDNYKRFEVGYRLIPATDEDATFRYFDQCVRYNCDPAKDFEYLALWGGVDLSTKTRAGTVMILGGITKEMKRVPIEVIYLDDQRKIEFIFEDWHEKYGSNIMYVNVENNSTQDAIIDRFRETPIPIRKFLTGRNKSDPQLGLPALDVEFDNGKWIFPIPHDKGIDDNCEFCKLARAFRLHPYASETDSVMATWFFRNACMNYGRQVFA